jgi:hypothetical protein
MSEDWDGLNKLDALTEIADIADKIIYDATSLDETLPPHNQYIVDGDLIRELSAALDKLYAIEQQQLAEHEESSDIHNQPPHQGSNQLGNLLEDNEIR